MTQPDSPDTTASQLAPAHLALIASVHLGVLITIKRDGRPQSSNISYAYDPATALVSISTTAPTVKVANLRRDPRANLHVMAPDGWNWVAAEATAVLSPIAQERDDATVEELVAIYRAVAGEHPDWDDFRRAMVEDQRLVVRLELQRTYGSVPR
ncbi:MAG TPA: PPOX class F420-dependent oxidoreductase [Acidothermaceae bacterium]